MNTETLLQNLKSWRRNTANLEGVEPFRVFANKVLENIAELKPKNKDELMAIKGIREKKFAKYGEQILAIVNNGDKTPEPPEISNNVWHGKPLSVSAYLNFLNRQLNKFRARIQGEIGSVDMRERVVYFSLKDSDGEGVINCLIWKNDYELSGIDFEDGMEVVLEGIPNVYEPIGKLTFKASSAELVGEGALKRAYDKLKKKLEAEGLFLEERKRAIPDLPQKIGLITSETGAAIGDFLTNLGQCGFRTKFMDSRVEGHSAVRDLMSAVDYFSGTDIDVLVIIRGGGSLESLQAFNNEALVRKIAGFNKPVICGIGHEKDVPLASMAADKKASTPTATAHILNESWQRAVYATSLDQERIFNSFNDLLSEQIEAIKNLFNTIKNSFAYIFKRFHRAEDSLKRSFLSLRLRILEVNKKLAEYPKNLSLSLTHAIIQTKQRILSLEKLMLTYSPEKQLDLGYSIVSSGGKIIKSVNGLQVGQTAEVILRDGGFESEIKNINKKQ